MTPEERINDILTMEPQVEIAIAVADQAIVFQRSLTNWTLFVEDIGADAPGWTAELSKLEKRGLTDTQVGALLALLAGLGEEDSNKALTRELYDIAEPVMTSVPLNLRIIP